MDINLHTKVAAFLEAYPELEDTLLKLSPVFAKLHNPVLRRTVARVTTLQQAAKVAEIPPGQMIQVLRKAAGLASSEIEGDEVVENQDAPVWFDQARVTIHFDARPVINAGQSPMQEIIRLSETLGQGDIMELIAPFEPVPIIDKLKGKGFNVWYANGKSYFIKQ